VLPCSTGEEWPLAGCGRFACGALLQARGRALSGSMNDRGPVRIGLRAPGRMVAQQDQSRREKTPHLHEDEVSAKTSQLKELTQTARRRAKRPIQAPQAVNVAQGEASIEARLAIPSHRPVQGEEAM
jgi:hypothetical protein